MSPQNNIIILKSKININVYVNINVDTYAYFDIFIYRKTSLFFNNMPTNNDKRWIDHSYILYKIL